RESEWRPNLMGEVDVPAGATVFYSQAGNPIRPEYSSAGTQSPNWSTTPPSDITQVRSIKIDFGARVLQPMEEMSLEWPMRAPAGAPTDGRIAWNSFGYLAVRNDNGDRLLPAEPVKVGISIKPGTGAIYGDRVWVDNNRNGIQDEGERGLNNIQVILKRPGPDGVAGTSDDIEVATANTADDAEGHPGYYLFPELPSGDYFAHFRPSSYWTVTGADNGTNDAVDSDVDSVTLITAITHLDNSEHDLSWDMGVYRVSSMIGNRVWQDVNRNGLQDDGEPGVAGVRVILHRSSDGAVVDSTLTANDGSYGFANLDPSNYYLQFRLPNDYLFTVQNAGGDDQLDSDVEPATGRTPSTSIAADEADLSWDAGVYKIPASIGNFIWEDLNVNGIQDPGEPGIAGVTLNLYDSHDALVASDTTDSSGYYGFTGVSPDTFYLQVVSKPSGYLASPVNQGTDDAKDSDAFIADGRMTMTELTPGENDLDWDAGFYRLAAFGDRIWRDDNKDGVQNDTEPGLANVRVFLHDSNDQAVDSTLTDENGYYTFDGLMPGAYNITVVKPDGFAFTTANVGGNDALDSDVAIDTGKSCTITLQSGDHQTGWDGGLYVLYVSLGDYVWHDLNRDGQQNVEEPGVPGVRVVLTSASDQVIAADTTDANGYYLFDQLPTGAYKVLFEKPAGHLFTTALSGSSATDSDADSTTGITAVITLAPASERRDIDAGLVALASIGDFVWLDLDADGLQDAGETGIPGVVVHLLNHDGDRVASDTTDASGYYRFTDLEPALYTIQVEPPAGLVVSPANAGTDEALDSDISGSLLQTAETRLSPGENDLHWDAGFFPLSAVGNYVWEDRNMDGVQDAGEKPWPNLEVRLLDSQQTLIRTAYTDSSGFYLFDQVMPGQYYVQFVIPPEEVLSPANAGSSEETDSDADVTTGLTSLIDLTPGEIDLSWDAGLYGLVGVGNFVWYDLDQDGLQDSGEPGAPDVRINLYDSDRRFLQSMVTDQNGYYYFSMLPPGSYFLEFVAPPDYAFSPRIPLQYDTNSDADPLTGRTERITLRQGKDDVTWDAGLIRASAIGNYVWLDKNQDGVQDAGEPGLADVRVDLHNAAGQLTGSTQTDSSGVYWFEHLEAGSYTVRVVETTLPPGVVCTTENNPMAASVEKGERYEDADFGYFLATASIGEYVWYDSNRDGSKQPTEQGLPNVVLILKDENGRVLGVTQTDEQGYYVFENLLNGRYYVQVDASSLPPTYYLTSGERVITIAVSEARYYPDANFGFAETELMGCGRRIIAWYEPWYGNAQQDSTLRHWNPLYRGGAADTSLFSLYDSREAKTWEYDILLAWASGIDGFVVDWFGKISYENTGLNGLLDTAEDLYQRFHGSGFDFQIICAYDELALGRLDTNFVYLADSLLEHPAYWGKRSGERRPVVTFDWRKPRYTHADYQAAADSLLPADVYLLHSDRADTAYVDSLKAGDLFYPWVQTLPTLWDIPFGLEWGKPYLEGFYRDAEARPETFRRVFSMGSVWPGFDDRPWQLGINRWISRQDTMVYHYTWEMAENTLSGHTWPWILVESWNDFNRATQIEPSTNWDYKHIVQTRDRAYRYKLGNANCAPEYIENLGLLVPQHIRQARLAAEKYPALATQIHAKTEEAVQRFFERDFLSAISLADEASGLSMEPFRVDAVTSHSVTLQWQPAERANGYVLYYTNEADRLQPCSYWRPDSILIGNATSYTLDSLQSNHKVYLALCAIDSVLGPHANTSWYTNNLKGIQPLSVQTLSDPEEPPAQADGLALFCVAGSPTFSGQGWDNAVDADLAGWDGTVTTRGDAQGTGSQQQTHQGPAWAIFSFSSDSLRRFNTVSIQTDNGIAEQYVRNRWASKLEVLVSETDTSATAFTSMLVFNRTSGNMTSFTLPDMVKARFVKLVIHQPNRTSGAWRQIVEFQVSLQTTM
ncbi:hypothetical protein GX408_11365, partial [bacterium]|nr:hypothetical protein [bacterium]